MLTKWFLQGFAFRFSSPSYNQVEPRSYTPVSRQLAACLRRMRARNPLPSTSLTECGAGTLYHQVLSQNANQEPFTIRFLHRIRSRNPLPSQNTRQEPFTIDFGSESSGGNAFRSFLVHRKGRFDMPVARVLLQNVPVARKLGVYTHNASQEPLTINFG